MTDTLLVLASDEHFAQKPQRWYELVTQHGKAADNRPPEEVALSVLQRAGITVVPG